MKQIVVGIVEVDSWNRMKEKGRIVGLVPEIEKREKGRITGYSDNIRKVTRTGRKDMSEVR